MKPVHPEEATIKLCRNVYQRIEAVDRCLLNHEWLAEAFEGDEFKANEYLGQKYFPELVSWIDLQTILNVYREFPDEPKWQEYHYNLRAMYELYRERKKAADSEEAHQRKRTNWKQIAEELKIENQSLREQIRILKQQQPEGGAS